MDVGVDPILDRVRYWLGWLRGELCARQTTGDLGENVGDLRTQQSQNGDDDDRHKNEDHRVLNQALTFFTW